MATKITLRGDTKANWESVNPILSAREMVIETDTNKTKIGNGTSTFTELKYVDTRPYKKWVGILGLSGGTFSTVVLENDLGGDITWSNPSNGTINATTSGLFTTGKTFGYISGVPLYIHNTFLATTSIWGITLKLHDGTQTSTPNFSNLSVEIRVYE